MRAVLCLVSLATLVVAPGCWAGELPVEVRYSEVAGVHASLNSLDLYPATAEEPAPIVVFVHGGGWRTGDKAYARTRSSMNDGFRGRGHAFVAIDHRIIDDKRSPKAFVDRVTQPDETATETGQ